MIAMTPSWSASTPISRSCFHQHRPLLQTCLSQHIACTDCCPNIVVWGQSSITIVELTVPYKLCIDAAVNRKTSNYSPLMRLCRQAGYSATLLTVEVGSRGFINSSSFYTFYSKFPAKRTVHESLEKDVVRKCLLESYRIWCKRNWKEPAPS